MVPRPIFDDPNYIGSGKLKNKVIIVTGGDSGLGRAASIAYAKEGAMLVIVYYDEDIQDGIKIILPLTYNEIERLVSSYDKSEEKSKI